MIIRLTNQFALWGFTPGKLLARLNNNSAPKLLSNSIPKSGTHLLERLLYLLPGISRQLNRTLVEHPGTSFDLAKQCSRLKKGQFIVSHLFYREEYLRILDEFGIKVIFMARDPRDIVISDAHYITYINKRHGLHERFINRLKSDKERLHFCIKGCPERPEWSIASLLEKFYPWLKNEKVLTVRFKDLVGVKGGGSDKMQEKTVDEILNFIGVEISREKKCELMGKIFFPRSKTFRKGRIRQWQKAFDDEDKKLFKEVAGEWLIKYGYEKDLNW